MIKTHARKIAERVVRVVLNAYNRGDRDTGVDRANDATEQAVRQIVAEYAQRAPVMFRSLIPPLLDKTIEDDE
ncbi:MAG: hypothetical protein A2Y38_22600 [Spirochaetes bacterium GWB1_59_5]|nr:MAG: hypothetical protein A2Y38_22600 [Spirochaetes bacterium GWB1_59_5]